MKRMKPAEMYVVVTEEGEPWSEYVGLWSQAVEERRKIREMYDGRFRIAKVRVTEPRARGRRRG